MTGHHATDQGYPQGGGGASTPIHTPSKSLPSSNNTIQQGMTMTPPGGGGGSDEGQPRFLNKSGSSTVDSLRVGGNNDNNNAIHVETEPDPSDKVPLHGLAWMMDAVGLSTLYHHNPVMALMSVMVVVWVILDRPLALLFLALPMLIYSWLA